MLEMYASARGRRLLALIAATYGDVPRAEEKLAACRETMASMTVP